MTMGYYGWFRIYVNSETPFGVKHLEELANYIVKNIKVLDPESATAIYYDVENGVLDSYSFDLYELEKGKGDEIEEWFPKADGKYLYKFESTFKYPSQHDLKLLLDAAKACFPDTNFIVGTMDDNSYNLSQMGITKEELLQFQKDCMWIKKSIQGKYLIGDDGFAVVKIV